MKFKKQLFTYFLLLFVAIKFSFHDLCGQTTNHFGETEEITKNVFSKSGEIINFRKEAIVLYNQLKTSIKHETGFKQEEIDKLIEQTEKRQSFLLYMKILLSQLRPYVKLLASEKHPEKLSDCGILQAKTKIFVIAKVLLDDIYKNIDRKYDKYSRIRHILNAHGKHPNVLDTESSHYSSIKDLIDKKISYKALKNTKKCTFQTNEIQLDKQIDLFLIDYLHNSSVQKPKDFYWNNGEIDYQRIIKYKWLRAMHKVSDNLFQIKDFMASKIAKIFGTTVGSIQFRKGKLYNNKRLISSLKAHLKPGDVLFDTTLSKVSAMIISLTGFWGHNAVYIGNEQQLKELGIWEHESIKPLQSDIKNGKVIIEALSDGVKLHSIKHFTNIDHFAVVRRKNHSRENILHGVLSVIGLLNKEYDYGLNVEDRNKIFCTELATIFHNDVKFESKKINGNFVVLPDNFAAQCGDSMPFNVEYLYIHGEKIKDNKNLIMQKTIGKNPRNYLNEL